MEERRPRKLLVASIGVATLVYAACSSGGRYGETSGNLVAPDTGPAEDVGLDVGGDTAVQDTSKDSNDDG